MTALTLDDFDFDLPEDLIALRPATPRPSARLLVARGTAPLEDAYVGDIATFLRSGDMLVLNDTKVIPARLRGRRVRQTPHGSGDASVEVTLIAPGQGGEWTALARPAKRLAPGDVITFSDTLSARVLDRQGGEVRLQLAASGPSLDAELEQQGEMPLPPYIASKRSADDRDKDDYQTVFARRSGAVAAPTASLHFDKALLSDLSAMGVETTFVTLHVGAGTFLPVTVDNIETHKMHAEWGEVSHDAAAQLSDAKSQGQRILPVGTTALRLIETAAQNSQIRPFRGETDIFIRPGYRFRAADGLMTNFHLPRTTLMMLVSALMGTDRIREIYAHAIDKKYRFFSYGDSSLLLPQE